MHRTRNQHRLCLCFAAAILSTALTFTIAFAQTAPLGDVYESGNGGLAPGDFGSQFLNDQKSYYALSASVQAEYEGCETQIQAGIKLAEQRKALVQQYDAMLLPEKPTSAQEQEYNQRHEALKDRITALGAQIDELEAKVERMIAQAQSLTQTSGTSGTASPGPPPLPSKVSNPSPGPMPVPQVGKKPLVGAVSKGDEPPSATKESPTIHLKGRGEYDYWKKWTTIEGSPPHYVYHSEWLKAPFSVNAPEPRGYAGGPLAGKPAPVGNSQGLDWISGEVILRNGRYYFTVKSITDANGMVHDNLNFVVQLSVKDD
jgi:hypothetical protein